MMVIQAKCNFCGTLIGEARPHQHESAKTLIQHSRGTDHYEVTEVDSQDHESLVCVDITFSFKAPNGVPLYDSYTTMCSSCRTKVLMKVLGTDFVEHLKTVLEETP